MSPQSISWAGTALLLSIFAGPSVAEPSQAPPTRELLFGETHMHSAYSLDAFIGGSALEPDDAYRFAKGEEVEMAGRRVRIIAPLDFMCLSDHAEFLGEMYSSLVADAPGHNH